MEQNEDHGIILFPLNYITVSQLLLPMVNLPATGFAPALAAAYLCSVLLRILFTPMSATDS